MNSADAIKLPSPKFSSIPLQDFSTWGHIMDAVLAASSDHALVLDRECRALYISPAASTALGLEASEILGKTAQEVGLPPDTCLRLTQDVEAVFTSGQPLLGAAECPTVDGPRLFEYLLAPIHDDAGQVIAVVRSARDVTEARRAEAALRRSEERWRHALKAASAGAWSWDLVTGDQHWSEENWRLFGMEPESHKLTYELWLSCIHPEDKEHCALAMSEALAKGTDYEFDFRVMRRGGTVLWICMRGRVERDAAGNAIRVLGINLDITERRALDEELRQGHEWLQLTTEAGKVGTWEWDITTGQVVWSEQMQRNAGFAPGGFEGTIQAFRALVHPQDAPSVTDALQRALAGKADYAVEFRMIRPDGQVRWALTRGVVVRDTEGTPLRMFGADADITEAREQRARLEEAYSLLDAVTNAAPVGFCLVDRALRYCYINTRLAAMNGATPEAHLGKTIREIVPYIAEMLEAIVHEVVETGHPRLHIEVTAPSAETPEEVRYWLASYYPVRDLAGMIVGVGCVVVEVTQERRTQAEIEHLNVRLRVAIAESHHRIKNNLQVLSSLIELQRMEGEEAIPEDQLQRLSQHVGALAILHDLLTADVRTATEFETLPLKETIQKIMDILQATAQGNVTLIALAEISLNHQKAASFVLLLNELVSNALKHGKGQVEVSLTQNRDYAKLEVCDDGAGFPVGFDSLKAAHTGLELVESLGRRDLEGEITYENRSDGGARVTVSFPLQDGRRM